MKLMVGDVFTTIQTVDQRVIGIARSVCSARPKGYKHMPKYRSGQWDGYISLMKRTGTFPTGLLGYVVQALKERGYKPEVSYTSMQRPLDSMQVDPTLLNGITLRDYQIDAIQSLLKASRGVAKMATNSGKTEVMAALIKLIGGKTLVLLHRKELMYQTAERFQKRLGCNVGMIGDGLYYPNDVTVAMIQTLSGHMDDFRSHAQKNVLLMVDECHHTSSNTMMDVLMVIPGWYRFGFSGTPLKRDELDDLKLMAATGRVVCEVTNTELIEEGHSAKPIVEIHVVESKESFDSYHDAYAGLIVKNDERNCTIAKIAQEADGTVLVLVERLEHGRALQSMIEGAVFANGKETTDARRQILKDMQEKGGVYIATPIFDEGVDVPGVDTVVLAGGGKSQIKLLQRIGRGLRKKEGRNILRVHDFLDDTNKHLLNHSEARISVYEAEGFDIRIKAQPGKIL